MHDSAVTGAGTARFLGLSLSDVRSRCLRRGIEYSISDSKEHLIRLLLQLDDAGNRHEAVLAALLRAKAKEFPKFSIHFSKLN